jgi:protein phosphatase
VISYSIQAQGATDIGMVRTNNEDAYYISPANDLFLVADGMGGHAGGEVASATIVEIVAAATRDPLTWHDVEQELADLLSEADTAVRAKAVGDLTSMGSTVVAMYVNNDRYWIAHAGDSRAYRLRDRELTRLTTDHTPLNDLQGLDATCFRTGMITRAVGVGEKTEFDLTQGRLVSGDRYLLCSDGLTDAVSEDRIVEILLESRDTRLTAQLLVEAANAAGGPDNITALVVDLG